MTEKTATLIGPGEVGTRLAGALEAAGWKVERVTRASGWDLAADQDNRSPRIVAVREEDVGPVLDRLGAALRDRLLLVQNGFLEAVHDDLGRISRGLIWFMSKKEVFHELTASLFYGPLSAELAPALRAGGLNARRIVEQQESLRAMIVKGVWNCVVGLPLAINDVDLETYLTRHTDELAQLVRESCRAASAEYGVVVSADEALETVRETTLPIRFVRGGKKALAWRNGAIAKFGRRHEIDTPVTDRLLAAAGYEFD